MERSAFVIYLLLLVICPLLFGAMHAYVYSLMSLGVLAGAVLLVIKNIRKDRRKGIYQFRLPKTSLNFAFLTLLGFLIFQMMPLPEFLLNLLSPESGIVWKKSWSAADIVNSSSGLGSWQPLAAYVYPVRMSLVRFTTYGLFFFGFIQVLNSRKRIELAIFLILALGCFEAIYGLIQAYSGSSHVLWKSIGARIDAKGTYINRNHFAGLMAMGMLLSAAFAAGLSERTTEKPSSRKRKTSLRAKLTTLLASEGRISKRVLVLFSGVVIGIGVFFSASRGGIVSAAIALLCISLFLVLRKDQRRKGWVFLALSLLIWAYSLDIGVDYVLSRFDTMGSSMDDRIRFAHGTLEIMDDFKLAGAGFGNFKYVYPRYQAPEDTKVFIRFAHNDWAQFLAEAGITGFVLLLAGMAYYFYATISLWKKRHDPFAVCLGLAPIAVLTAMAIHSLSDFNLHIPANFLILVAIMAIGFAALHLERHHRRDRMNYRYYHLPLKYRGGVAFVLVFGLIGWSGWWSIRHFMAEAYCNTVPNSTLNRDKNPPVGKILGAIEWDGSNAEYWYKLGIKLRSADYADSRRLNNERKKLGSSPQRNGLRIPRGKDYPSTISRTFPGEATATTASLGRRAREKDQQKLQMKIISALEQAVRLNPFEAQYHLRLGWEYAHLWKEVDYHKRWLPAADICMDRAAYFAGEKNPRLHVELGNYWIMRSKSVLPNNAAHHEAWARACWHYRKAQSLEHGTEGTGHSEKRDAQRKGNKALKRMKKDITDYVWNFYPDEGFMDQVIVEN